MEKSNKGTNVNQSPAVSDVLYLLESSVDDADRAIKEVLKTVKASFNDSMDNIDEDGDVGGVHVFDALEENADIKSKLFIARGYISELADQIAELRKYKIEIIGL